MLLAILRRGFALGGALTVGVAGSLFYESQVQSVEAETAPAAHVARVSVWLEDDGATMASRSGLSSSVGTVDVLQDGTMLLPPCSSGRVRRR